MLKFLRKNTKVIVWAVVVAFVAWGGYAVSIQFEASSRSPGRIFGKEISFRDYLLANRAVQIFTPQAQDATPPDPVEIEARTWEFLVLSQEAKRRKIDVSDEEVRREIARLLGETGSQGFSGEQYQRWVRSTLREEPREFENQLRDELRIQKLLAEVREGTGPEAQRRLRRWMVGLFRRARVEVYPQGT